jgi:hypothetical protein
MDCPTPTTFLVDNIEVLVPKHAAELITNSAKDVTVVQEGIGKTARKVFEEIHSGRLDAKRFKQSEHHPSPTDERCIDWIFVVDTLNFSFWSGEESSTSNKDAEEGSNGNDNIPEKNPKWEVKYNGKIYTGYFALCAGINRAIEEGVDMRDPKIYGNLTEKDILHIFRSETSTPIPMIADRVKNLKEASQVLLEKYQGSFVNCVKACGQNAQRLLRQVLTDFPCYRDHCVFETRTVGIWKRAQILIGDIWACHLGNGLGAFDDIDTLTMFADYRIPQVLLYFGALKYSEDLYDLLQKNQNLENGDRREVEIRGASIHAVELIKDKVRELLTENNMALDLVNSVIIDHFLWDYRRENEKELDKFPYHKTRCIYY